ARAPRPPPAGRRAPGPRPWLSQRWSRRSWTWQCTASLLPEPAHQPHQEKPAGDHRADPPFGIEDRPVARLARPQLDEAHGLDDHPTPAAHPLAARRQPLLAAAAPEPPARLGHRDHGDVVALHGLAEDVSRPRGGAQLLGQLLEEGPRRGELHAVE